jgi:hypothetical protein
LGRRYAEQASSSVQYAACCGSITRKGIYILVRKIDPGRVRSHLPVAINIRVVPVSTIPAVLAKIDVEAPYLIDSITPQNSDEGNVAVIGLYMMHDENIC